MVGDVIAEIGAIANSYDLALLESNGVPDPLKFQDESDGLIALALAFLTTSPDCIDGFSKP